METWEIKWFAKGPKATLQQSWRRRGPPEELGSAPPAVIHRHPHAQRRFACSLCS